MSFHNHNYIAQCYIVAVTNDVIFSVYSVINMSEIPGIIVFLLKYRMKFVKMKSLNLYQIVCELTSDSVYHSQE